MVGHFNVVMSPDLEIENLSLQPRLALDKLRPMSGLKFCTSKGMLTV